MRKFAFDFFSRGVKSCGIGPIVLAVLYLIMYRSTDIETLTVSDAVIGIFSLTALAFIAGGINALYQVEQLPLMLAIFIHGGVLYISYLVTYLLNSWLEWGIIPWIVFTLIFIVGYIVIWVIIYSIIKKNTAKLNDMLKKQRE